MAKVDELYAAAGSGMVTRQRRDEIRGMVGRSE